VAGANKSAISLALRNASLRRAIVAYASSIIAEWSLWVGVLVYAFNHGGPRVVGLTSLVLVVPGLVIAPITGSLADGPRPLRVLAYVYAGLTVALGLAAACSFGALHPVTVIALCSLAVTMIAFIRPTFVVVMPSLVMSAGELTAANLLTGYCASSAVLVGPLIAAALLAIDGPSLVFAACAGLMMISAVAMATLVRLDPPRGEAFQDESPPSHSLRRSVRDLSERPGAISLLAVLAGEHVLVGALDLLYVILAVDVLGMTESGAGVLNALFGVGALAGAALSTLVVGNRRLAPVIIASLVGIVALSVALGAAASLIAAIVVFPLLGIGQSIVDLTGRMLMQRSAPQDALASVFAVMEALTSVGTVIGTVIVQISLVFAGARAALIAIAAFFAVLLAVTFRGLRRVDASADAPVVAIRLLRRVRIFAHLPGPELEGIARAANEVSVAPGDAVIREGEVGDRYYAIVRGHVEVSEAGVYVRTMTRGEGFGEIALLADEPRTATVIAKDDVDLLSIERAPFLTAVTGHDASARTAWAVAREWHPTLLESPER